MLVYSCGVIVCICDTIAVYPHSKFSYFVQKLRGRHTTGTTAYPVDVSPACGIATPGGIARFECTLRRELCALQHGDLHAYIRQLQFA